MKKALLILSTLGAGVSSVFAQVIGTAAQQGQVNGGALLGLLALAQTIVARLVPFAIGLAVLAFFWFLIRFIWLGKEDAETKKISLQGMGYSVLALFVMVSIWGIIGLMGSIFGVNQGGNIPAPGIPLP
jgi:hypothetical protein